MSTVTFGQKSDVGRVRKMNQDSVAALTAEELDRCADALFIVADGMGGRSGGEVASRVTVETIPQVVREELVQLNGGADAEGMAAVLREGVTAANDAVWNQARSNPELRGMGTTCVGLLIKGKIAAICNVGDSRAYLLRRGELAQVTSDHSLVQEHVQSGELTEAEARASRYRNVITRGIGLTNTVTPDLDAFDLCEGDTILLCSDGLTNMLTDQQIGEIVAEEPDPQRACDLLVESANAKGGVDNISAVVVRYGQFNPAPLAKPSTREPDPPLPQQPQIVYQRPPSSPWKAVLLTVLFFVAAAGVGAAYIYQKFEGWPVLSPRHIPVLQKPKPQPSQPVKVEYEAPVVLTTLRFRGYPLLPDANGGVMAVNDAGRLVHVSRGGTVINQVIAPANMMGDAPGQSWASDHHGNYYLAQPASHGIEKYNAKGVRVAVIGSDRLKSPEAVAVNSLGDVFVIDDKSLKLFKVRNTPRKAGDIDAGDAAN